MKQIREHFASRMGIIMASAGSAIGLGTLWMFPYLTFQNGGGSFIFLFFLFTFLVGVPLFIAELSLGKKARRGVVGIFMHLEEGPSFWNVIGWFSFISAFLIFSYYTVVAGWGLHYAWMSLCQYYKYKTPATIGESFTALESSSGMNILSHFSFNIMTAFIVYKGIRKGIEKYSKWITSCLFIMVLVLLGYSINLPGFSDSVTYLFSTDLSNISSHSALEALGLAFFTLSLGQGIMLTYGSYIGKAHNIPKVAIIVGSLNIVISFLIALMIFRMLFSAPATLERSGPGLIFQTLPYFFLSMPGAGVFSLAFFVLFCFTALTSSIAFLEVLVSNFTDLFNLSRKRAVVYFACASALFGIPSALSFSQTLFSNWKALYGMTFFETQVSFVSNWVLPINGLLIAIYVGWRLPKKKFFSEFSQGKLEFLFMGWIFLIKWLAPTCIIFLFLSKSGLIVF